MDAAITMQREQSFFSKMSERVRRSISRSRSLPPSGHPAQTADAPVHFLDGAQTPSYRALRDAGSHVQPLAGKR
jgi:hypothetical protein